MSEDKIRNSNIELLRILAATSVIVIHIAIYAFAKWEIYSEAPRINRMLIRLAHVMSVNAAPLFMMISGYFMSMKSRVDLKKPALLILQLVVFKLAIYIIRVFNGSSLFSYGELVSTIISLDYFVSLYCAVYLVSPYINFLLNKLEDKQVKALVTLLFIVFCLWNYAIDIIAMFMGVSLDGATTISMNGSLMGSTVVNFMICYIIGAAVRRNIISLKHPLLCYVLCVIMVGIISLRVIKVSSDYHSPFVLGQALGLLCLSLKWKFNSSIINRLAKSCYAVFILHFNLIVEMRNFLLDSLGCSLVVMLARMAGMILIIWIISILSQKAFDIAVRPFAKKLENKLSKVEIKV